MADLSALEATQAQISDLLVESTAARLNEIELQLGAILWLLTYSEGIPRTAIDEAFSHAASDLLNRAKAKLEALKKGAKA